MDRPLLSICIPTYNRASWLEKILVKMLEVCSNNNIHIYISDNASPDNTQEVGERFQNQYKFIHYFHHEANIGPDDNFEFVLKMADTKYRWLMSDTCYVDGIGDLISDLQSGEYDGYILNAPGSRGQSLPKEKKTYTESISIMRDMGWHLSWISCMIYNESLIKVMNFGRYKDSSFNQTALMFEPTANRPCRIAFNPNVIVKNLPSRMKESKWQYHVFDVMYRQWYIMIMSLPLYYPYETKVKCIEDNAKYPNVLTMRLHLRRRTEGKWHLADVMRNKFFIKQAKGNFWTLVLIGLIPVSILRLTKTIKNVFKK